MGGTLGSQRSMTLVCGGTGLHQVEVLTVHDEAVAPHLVGDAQVLGQVGVVEVVVDGEQTLVLVVLDDAGGALDVLELGQAGVRDTVGRDEPSTQKLPSWTASSWSPP